MAACSLISFGQYTIHSIDYTTPLYYGSDLGNPIGIGITLKNETKKYQLIGRVSGFSYGGFPQNYYQDTARRTFSSGDREVYKLPKGDSILTHTYSNSNAALGLQVGIRKDFELWTIPVYSSAHVGLFAQRYTYDLALSHTINSPDTNRFEGSTIGISDYRTGTTFTTIEDHGWSILPQVGLETGLVLSAGKRLQFIPKLVINLSYYRASVFQNSYAYSYAPKVGNNFALDIQTSLGLQVSYILKKESPRL